MSLRRDHDDLEDSDQDSDLEASLLDPNDPHHFGYSDDPQRGLISPYKRLRVEDDTGSASESHGGEGEAHSLLRSLDSLEGDHRSLLCTTQDYDSSMADRSLRSQGHKDENRSVNSTGSHTGKIDVQGRPVGGRSKDKSKHCSYQQGAVRVDMSRNFGGSIPFIDEICLEEDPYVSADEKEFPGPPQLVKMKGQSSFEMDPKSTKPLENDLLSPQSSYHPDYQTLECRKISYPSLPRDSKRQTHRSPKRRSPLKLDVHRREPVPEPRTEITEMHEICESPFIPILNDSFDHRSKREDLKNSMKDQDDIDVGTPYHSSLAKSSKRNTACTQTVLDNFRERSEEIRPLLGSPSMYALEAQCKQDAMTSCTDLSHIDGAPTSPTGEAAGVITRTSPSTTHPQDGSGSRIYDSLDSDFSEFRDQGHSSQEVKTTVSSGVSTSDLNSSYTGYHGLPPSGILSGSAPELPYNNQFNDYVNLNYFITGPGSNRGSRTTLGSGGVSSHSEGAGTGSVRGNRVMSAQNYGYPEDTLPKNGLRSGHSSGRLQDKCPIVQDVCSGSSSHSQASSSHQRYTGTEEQFLEKSFPSSLAISNRRARKAVLQSSGLLKIAAYMNVGLLTVSIVKARHLSSSWSQHCDAYVKMSLVPDETRRTRCKTQIMSSSNSPIFEEKFSIEILEEDKRKRLLVSVWHKDENNG